MGGHKRLGGEGGGGSHAKRRYVAPTPGVCELSRGMRGVLITCDTHLEHKAIKEAYRLLDDLAGGGAAAGDGGDGGDDGDGGSASGTAGDKLAAELAALKEGGGEGGGSGGGGTAHAKRFSVAQTGCAGTVLLRFSEEADDPTEIASRALGEAQARGESSAPHVIRLLPVQVEPGRREGEGGRWRAPAVARPPSPARRRSAARPPPPSWLRSSRCSLLSPGLAAPLRSSGGGGTTQPSTKRA